jgi:DNA-damage-inducible protein J
MDTMLIKAKVEPSLKYEVENIFEKLGLSASEAINLFYHQVKLRKGLPFDVVIPNKTTIKTFRDTDKGKNIIKCKNANDMFKKLKV